MLFFDNYFNFLELLIKLKKYKIWAVGALRKGRMRKCSLKSETELKKEGRGAFYGCIALNSSCSLMRWNDNMAVQLGHRP